ncbi:MAG: zf-HC2 domain-containing protein [Acidimicrobiia bacterium]
MSHPGDLLSAYLDGEASPADRRLVLEHLEGCSRCRDGLRTLEEARDAVRSLPMLEPPRIGRRPARAWRPSVAWALSGVAAAVIALGLAFVPDEPEAAFDFDTLRDQHTARLVVDPGISTLRGPAGDP